MKPPARHDLHERLDALPVGSERLPASEILRLVDLSPPDEPALRHALDARDTREALDVFLNPAVIEILLCWFFDRSYDPGPPCAFGRHFARAPDLGTLLPARFRPEFGPVFYRGRLDGSARLLVVGQDPGTDEQLARRSFVGESGQRVQGLLRKAGLSRSYAILNTFHLGVKGGYDDELETLSTTDPLLSWRNALFDMVVAGGSVQAVLAVGGAARDAVDAWPGAAGIPRADVVHPSAINFGIDPFPSWNAGVATLAAAVTPDPGMTADPSPYPATTFVDEVVDDIPRADLPWGTPSWFGRGGETRSRRDGDDELIWEHPPA